MGDNGNSFLLKPTSSGHLGNCNIWSFWGAFICFLLFVLFKCNLNQPGSTKWCSSSQNHQGVFSACFKFSQFLRCVFLIGSWADEWADPGQSELCVICPPHFRLQFCPADSHKWHLSSLFKPFFKIDKKMSKSFFLMRSRKWLY